MKVEVITVPDCPHREATVAHVRTALGALGRKDVVVMEREVDEADEAAAAELRGSPTVLVDGADLFGGGDEPSLSCRLGPPSVASLVDAFHARQSATIGRTGFAALWRGEQPLIDELCDGDRAVIDRMAAAGRIEWDESGRLTGVHGLTTRSTAHRIEHRSGAVHTWCALDAIGIPAALGIDAVAATRCPTCGSELRVRIKRGVPVDGESFRLWLPSTDCEHLVNDFCQHANLYCTDAHVPSRAAPAGRTIAVAEAAAIGRHVWSDVSVPRRQRRR